MKVLDLFRSHFFLNRIDADFIHILYQNMQVLKNTIVSYFTVKCSFFMLGSLPSHKEHGESFSSFFTSPLPTFPFRVRKNECSSQRE